MNLLDLLFPKQCLECKKFGKYICEDCLKKVTPAGCDKNNYSVFKYEGVIRKAIIALKYKFATDIAEELNGYMVKWLKDQNHLAIKPSDNIVLVPIPLHKHRQNWRGFNQAELMGEKLAKSMSWKFIPDLLIRTKNTVPQVGLKGLARRSNLSDVFCLNSNYLSNNLFIYSSIMLFDDVYTTGSTINEARKVLQGAGFKNIKNLTIAR